MYQYKILDNGYEIELNFTVPQHSLCRINGIAKFVREQLEVSFNGVNPIFEHPITKERYRISSLDLIPFSVVVEKWEVKLLCKGQPSIKL